MPTGYRLTGHALLCRHVLGRGSDLADTNLRVSAVQERKHLDVRLYVLALIAFARQLQQEEEQTKEVVRD